MKMTNQHPITPPPELVQQWLCSDDYQWGPLEQTSITITTNRLQNVATQAAQWGADQELEACCKWVNWKWSGIKSRELRAARRPKPPSLKEQALETLQRISQDQYPCNFQEDSDWDTIRLALEALDD
jgi:hypothetical protein